MSQLKSVGYWNRVHDESYIWPQEIVTSDVIENKELIIQYIKNGTSVIHWMGFSSCRICEEHLGCCCLTDGIWIWPEKLEHYVEKHNILLPEEFIKTMEDNKWKVPKVEIDEGTAQRMQSWDFWTGWCKDHRNPEKNVIQNIVKNGIYLPIKSNVRIIKGEMLHDLFCTIEAGLDMVVDTLILPEQQNINKEFYDKTFDKDNNAEYCWSANVFRNGDLIIAASKEFNIKSVLVCKNAKYIILCQDERSVLVGTKIERQYCPELSLLKINKDNKMVVL